MYNDVPGHWVDMWRGGTFCTAMTAVQQHSEPKNVAKTAWCRALSHPIVRVCDW